MNPRFFPRPLAALALSAAGAFVVSPALADEPASSPAACVTAAGKAQKLRNAHDLVEARIQLRVCAAATCPAVVQSDCVSWLAEVEKSLPSVVVTAKSGAGADLVDVKVTVDGKLLVTKLDGQAVTMNAGAHAFHFESADGTVLDREVVVAEGDKNHAVSVVLGAATVAAPPGAPAASSSESSAFPWRTTGWVVGGVGAAGVVLGAVFGAVALADKSSANCVNDVCNAGSLSGLRTTSLVSTVGLVGGGVLLAGGAALVFFGPRGSTEPGTPPASTGTASGGIRVAPVFVANGGEIMVGGSF